MKKEKKIKEATPESENLSLSDKMDAMIDGLNSVSGAVMKLVEMQTATKEANEKPVPNVVYAPHLEDETYPKSYIPPKFRQIVDEVLSKEFGVNVEDFPDRTDFQFSIIVPERFSSLTKIDKEKGVKDIRSRIIPRAMGENGVRDWCMLIRKNLNRFYQQEGVTPPFNEQVQ